MRLASLEIEDSDCPSYFWFYINVKHYATENTGSFLLYLNNCVEFSEDEALLFITALLRGKSIRRFYPHLPLDLLNRFAFPRANFETWKELT